MGCSEQASGGRLSDAETQRTGERENGAGPLPDTGGGTARCARAMRRYSAESLANSA